MPGKEGVIEQNQQWHEGAGRGGEAGVELMADEEPDQRGGSEQQAGQVEQGEAQALLFIVLRARAGVDQATEKGKGPDDRHGMTRGG